MTRYRIFFSIFIWLLIMDVSEVFPQAYCTEKEYTRTNVKCKSKPEAMNFCEEYKGRWYLVVPLCKTHKEANLYCKNLGLKLSTINSVDQSKWLGSKACLENREMFLAGPRRWSNAKWFFNIDHSPMPSYFFDFSYWKKSLTPNLCAVYGPENKKFLYIWRCTDKYKFFCQSKTKLPNCISTVDGKFDKWSSWTDCSKSCGGGQKFRTRKCNHPTHGGKKCEVKSEETEECGVDECPGKMAAMSVKSNNWIFVGASIFGCLLVIGFMVAIVIYRTKAD